MKLVLLTTDNRDAFRSYKQEYPWFGTAPEALLQGFGGFPSVEIHVVSCSQMPMKSPAKLADNIYFHSLHVPKIGWLRTMYQGCLRATRRKIREIRPDLVHGQGTERDCSLSAVFSGFSNVVTIHGNMAVLSRELRARPGTFNWFAGKLENWTLPRTGGVFCNSAYTENLVKPRARQTWRVPNALRSAFFSPPPARESKGVIQLLNIGVISPRKRQLDVLRMGRRLFDRGCRFHMRFLGTANPRDSYGAEFLREMSLPGVGAYATFSGFKDLNDLIEIFDQADGCIHFPSEEAFGLVVAEGLARNLKMFGASVGGIIDIMTGVDGAELFRPDDWEGLERGVADWIQKGAPRTVHAAAIMRDRYHPEAIAREHLRIYTEFLSSG